MLRQPNKDCVMELIQYPPNKKQQANGYKTTKIKQARDRQKQQVTNQSKRFTGAEENMLNIHELSGKNIINQHKMILSKKKKTFKRFMNIRKMELERERETEEMEKLGGGKDTHTYPHKE
jgi:hypothetical protein